MTTALNGSYSTDLDKENMGIKGAMRAKKIVKEKFCFPLFSINRYISALVGPIWTKKIWTYRAQRELSNDPDPVLLGDIVSRKKIVNENFFFLLFSINSYISAPIEPIWTTNKHIEGAAEAFQ
ncbi:hypothetical protein V1477_017808 [Vespula maculifrons]|uniref:Uncharacterized protein n=1 Tax=Vespula maculifrons TaxID=7453 RepID=A0ABD2B143_VESMC